MDIQAQPTVEAHESGATDLNLVARARSGEARAFEAIMRRYNRRLYRLARSFVKDDAEAEDVVQETYVTAFVKLHTFKGPHGFATWLSRIAVNEALGRLRQRSRITSLDADVGAGGLDLDGLLAELGRERSNPEASAATMEIRKLIEHAIDELPPNFRIVFMLRAVEGLSIEETASTLDIKLDTVKTRFHRARKMLQKGLNDNIRTTIGSTFPFEGARCDRIVRNVFRTLHLEARGSPGSSADRMH